MQDYFNSEEYVQDMLAQQVQAPEQLDIELCGDFTSSDEDDVTIHPCDAAYKFNPNKSIYKL